MRGKKKMRAFPVSCLVVLSAIALAEKIPTKGLYLHDLSTTLKEPGTWDAVDATFRYQARISAGTLSADASVAYFAPDYYKQEPHLIWFLENGRRSESIPVEPGNGEIWNVVLARNGGAIAYSLSGSDSGRDGINVRKRVENERAFSAPVMIHPEKYKHVCGISNDGETVLLYEGLVSDFQRLMVIRGTSASVREPVLLSREDEVGVLVMSANGNWVFFCTRDRGALFSRFQSGFWTEPKAPALDTGQVFGVSICNTDASWLMSAYSVIQRIEDTFLLRWEIKSSPDEFELGEAEMSEDGHTVAFMTREPQTPKPWWQPPQRQRLYIARYEEGGQPPQPRITLIDEGQEMSFHLTGDGQKILWMKLAPDTPSAVEGWQQTEPE